MSGRRRPFILFKFGLPGFFSACYMNFWTVPVEKGWPYRTQPAVVKKSSNVHVIPCLLYFTPISRYFRMLQRTWLSVKNVCLRSVNFGKRRTHAFAPVQNGTTSRKHCGAIWGLSWPNTVLFLTGNGQIFTSNTAVITWLLKTKHVDDIVPEEVFNLTRTKTKLAWVTTESTTRTKRFHVSEKLKMKVKICLGFYLYCNSFCYQETTWTLTKPRSKEFML